MRNFKLTIEYDGTLFNGWQIQPGNNRTIQGEIENALKKIFKKKTKLYGSGRTDTGVHALGQVANFKASTKMTEEEVVKALNSHLPEDIIIKACTEVKDKFHAQYSAKSKIYRYTILSNTLPSTRFRNTSLFFPYTLNLKVMKDEAKALIGRKNFTSFQASDAKRNSSKSSIRTIKKIDIKKKGDFIYIDVEANGFLYKMVRNIVGTLLDAGQGFIPEGSVARILKAKDRSQASDTAQPQGLCLLEVKY